MTQETKFLQALKDIFVGATIEGESGYINLMRIKARYFERGVFPLLMQDIDAAVAPFPGFREELFDKLYDFFHRYFSESGSIYFRYTPLHERVYEKVYTDERDVALFYKTHMLYYVKTDRLFHSMDVVVDGLPFHFDVHALEHKRANEKRALVFEFQERRSDNVLALAVSYSENGRKTRLDEMARAVRRTGVRVEEETLERAMRLFERQSEVDFFINKDARAFLREQFDLWLFQYVFEPEGRSQTLWSERRIRQLQVLKDTAYKIIDFIAQFEDELVRIWNKPKFVRASHYIVTLERIAAQGAAGQALLARFLAHPNLAAQVEEWRELGMVGEDFVAAQVRAGDGAARQLDQRYQFLPLDTRHFPDLEGELTALFDHLDDALDGWLIRSDNYQALLTLAPKYREQVKCIYIDPPYNATTTEIVYPNTFKHSSWLTMMENRIAVSRDYLESKGVYVIAIDENEQERLGLLVKDEFPGYQFTCVTIVHNPSGQQGDNFSYCHDFAYFVYPSKSGRVIGHEVRDEDGSDTRNFRDVTGAESLREAAANCFYPILVKDGNIIGFGAVSDDDFHPGSPNVTQDDGVIAIYPVDPQNVERKWRFARQTVETIQDELRVKYIKKRDVWDIERTKNVFNFKTVWTDSKYSANNHGTQVLNHIVGKDLFTFPKSIFTVMDSLRAGLSESMEATVLDFFAGSGTTAHAVMNLNREDDGQRKYILVEMGEHFETVILPRIKKIAFSDQWRDGVAQAGGRGISHFVKYFTLEQYEDVLRRAVYGDAEPLFIQADPYSQYVFLRDLKLLDNAQTGEAVMTIDPAADEVHVHLARLYPDVDVAETLSCVTGQRIRRLLPDEVEFEDGQRMSLLDPPWDVVKPLIWW